MFITEDQLFELKYRLGGKYYGLPLAEIFLKELYEFSKGSIKLDLISEIKYFYHRYIYEYDYWDVKFSDNSELVIEKDEYGNWSSAKVFKGSYSRLVTHYKFEY